MGIISCFVKMQILKLRKPKGLASTSLNEPDSNSDLNETDEPYRYQACEVLISESLPCLIWGEDALGHHGVPTILFDVFLLVHDPE